MTRWLYQADNGRICAGFLTTPDGYVTDIAPVLARYGATPGIPERLERSGYRVTRIAVVEVAPPSSEYAQVKPRPRRKRT